MNSVMWSRRFLEVLMIYSLVGFLYTIALDCHGTELSEADLDQYLKLIGRVNHYSVLDHAGSHGTLGFGVGVGVASYEATSHDELRKQYWRGANQQPGEQDISSDSVYVRRIYLYKGLPNAVDVGLGLGQELSTGAQVLSGYAQWNLFERFAMPALAVRGIMSRIVGMADVDASSFGVDGVISYGFLRYFTLYGTLGVSQNNVALQQIQNSGTTFVLTHEGTHEVKRVFSQKSESIGLQVQLYPPFCNVATEVSAIASGSPTYMAKISVGL